VNLALVADRGELLKSMLLAAKGNQHTRRAYARAFEKFLSWFKAEGGGELSRQALDLCSARQYLRWTATDCWRTSAKRSSPLTR
jgi:hypothetical protein